jgi:hypothetical protein
VDSDDLLRMLDLPGQEAAREEAAEPAITPSGALGTADASPTALELDDWGLRRGRESDRLRQTGLDEWAMADFHGAAFEPEPRLKEACADPLRLEFLGQLLQASGYRALHTCTRLDPAASAIAACAFAEQFAELRESAEKGSGGEGRDGEMAALRAAGRAAAEASKEVEECREACAALGLGPGCPGGNDPKAIASLFRRVRNSKVLRRICELAGRYRRLAQSRQRQKAVHGLDDVVGVELGGDLGRLLPHELAKLAGDDEFADDALRRLLERQLMCREHRASEPAGRGPLICCVDESSSMHGEKGLAAKALALALAWVTPPTLPPSRRRRRFRGAQRRCRKASSPPWRRRRRRRAARMALEPFGVRAAVPFAAS